MQTEQTDTPLMRQYYAIKENYPDTLLLFQVGDFYELFLDDAKTAAAFLGITLTARGKHKGEPIPLCGVPVHALDHYLSKLVRGGFRVALCDQLSEPVPGKVVERGVTQVLTPGTLTDVQLLDEKKASYLLAFYPTDTHWGLVFGELMTANLFGTVIPAGAGRVLEAELSRFFPDEIVIPKGHHDKEFCRTFKALDYCVSPIEFAHQSEEESAAWIECFDEMQKSYIKQHEALKCALRTFYAYIRRTQHTGIDLFTSLQLYRPDEYLMLDAATQRNLELMHATKDGKQKNTLFWVLDGAVTPMGSRMIKKWIARPLLDQEAIKQRLAVVQLLVSEVAVNQHIAHILSKIGDLERIVGRIALGRGRLHDYWSLASALSCIPQLKKYIESHSDLPLITIINAHIDDFSALQKMLSQALNDDLSRDWQIRAGFDQQLDYLRDLTLNGQQKIFALERQEQEKTGIASLKVRYNQVHGYYIEITKAHSNAIPAHYVRSQTLVGRERFTTPELNHLQQQLLYAQAEAASLEKVIFERVRQDIVSHLGRLRRLAYALAHLDALIGFARVAAAHRYVAPTFTTSYQVMIQQGRHPIVERTLDYAFIPNDTHLDDTQSLLIVTGPNMGGKSTYLRQVALISIMAQCGSFVPAAAAKLPLFDRIFTRIGAGDNLAEGKSTFLIEMEETAAICRWATERSLVILDEVGRGTSTFDGLAIAQAVVEYIYTTVKARCIFATHYHELTSLHEQFPGIVSYYAASTKTDAGVLLLHTILPGKADGSFGIEVAKKTDMPSKIIRRAQEIIEQLANQKGHQSLPTSQNSDALHEYIGTLQNQIREADRFMTLVRDVSCDDLSPRQALDLVCKLKNAVNSVDGTPPF